MTRWGRYLLKPLVMGAVLCLSACGGGGAESSPVVDLSQIDGATGVEVDSSFQYDFSEAVDTGTVTASTFFIFPTDMAVSASVSKAAFDNTICSAILALAASQRCDTDSKCILDPTGNLSPGTRYTVCISPDIIHISGVAFEGFSATFTTADATDACNLSLSYAGPTAASTFAGLGEDAARCLMTSWREAFIHEEPEPSAIFVTTSCGQGADGSLAKPYCDIEDALHRAAEMVPHSDVPALYFDPGTYAMSITLGTQLSALKLRGLCSETTVLSPSISGSPIIADDGAVSASLSMWGLTLVGGEGAIMHVSMGNVALQQVHISQSVDNACFWVSGPNATLTAQSISFDGPVTSIIPPTPTSQGSPGSAMPIVGDQTISRCIIVEGGGVLDMEDFFLHDFQGVAIHVTGTGSQAKLTSGIVSDIGSLSTDGDFGYGMSVERGGNARLDRVSFSRCGGAGLLAASAGTQVAVTNSYFGQMQRNTYGATGVGAIVQSGAQGTIGFSLFEENEAPGIFLSNRSSTTVSDSFSTGNTFSNVALVDADMTLMRTSLGPTVSDPSESGGSVGLFIQSWSGDVATTAEVTRNIMTGSEGGGIYVVEHAGDEMDLVFEGNDIRENATADIAILPHVQIVGVSGSIRLDDNCIQSGAVTNPAGFGVDSSSGVGVSGNQYVGIFNPYVIYDQRCADAALDAIDIGAEILPPLSVTCICGVRSDTGGTVPPITLGPLLDYHFDIQETEAIE